MTTATDTYRYGRLKLHYFAAEQPAVAIGRGVYFPVRALCETLGLYHQSQRRRLKVDTRFREALRELPVPTVKGLRDTLCIRKQDVAKWLGLIDPAKCAIAKTRADLERFQADLFAAADRFMWGETGADDLAWDPATKTAAPVTGVLHVGHCPGCGMALCLTFDTDGAHLHPEADDQGDA